MYITVYLFRRIKVMLLCARKKNKIKKKKSLSKSRGKKFKNLIIVKVKNLAQNDRFKCY